MKAVLAYNRKQYEYWCRENYPTKKAADLDSFFIWDINTLHGLERFELILTGHVV